MDALNRLVDSIDKWPLRRLLIVNTVLGGFAALANGGALVLTISGKAPAFSADLPYMAALTAGAIAVLLLGIGVPFFPQMLGTALRVHGVLLLAFGCLILLEGINVAAQGPPEGIRFTWNVIMVVALVTYSVYFARRSLLTPVQLTRPVFRFSHLGAAIAALVVSALVFWRVLSTYDT